MKFFLVCSILMILSSATVAMLYHEQAHAAIFDNYGCNKTQIRWYWDKMTASCLERTGEVSDEERLAHSINETVGYHMLGFTGIIVSLLIIAWLNQIRTKKD